MVRLETAKTQFVVKPFLDEISKMRFRDKVMGELVGIVPRKLDVSTLLDVVQKYADIKDEEALKGNSQQHSIQRQKRKNPTM